MIQNESLSAMQRALRLEGGRPRAGDLPLGWVKLTNGTDGVSYVGPECGVKRTFSIGQSFWTVFRGPIWHSPSHDTAAEAIEWVEAQRDGGDA